MKGILAILMAGIMIAAMVAPAMSENADTSATVGNAAPDVSLVSVSPDSVTMDPCPNTTSITVTATVSDANGVGDIASVRITGISPTISGITPPITMDWSKNNSATEAEYTATIDLPCCTSADNYTVTVTVTDKDTHTSSDTGTDTFTVNPTVAITVTDVGFGSVAPGGNSTASSTVTCTGNAAVKFVDAGTGGYDNPDPGDGIVWSEMTSGTDTISDNQITTTWNSANTIACNNNLDASFKLDVPSGTPEGTYGGTITFEPTAV